MKRVLFLLLASFLVLGACGQKEDSKSDNKKSETTKKETKKDDKEKADKKKDKKNKKEDKKEIAEKQSINSNEDELNNTDINENNKIEQVADDTNSQVNINNISDRNTLESVINGNYSEEEKVQAYNSAVANGVIPQGNVMEGPASEAYQSSLRVENGSEKSVYEQANNKQDYENNGVYRTPQEQKAHEDWVNGQNEWNNATDAEKEQIRKDNAENYGYEYNPEDYEK